MAKGTFTRRARVLASSVLPQPVGPCGGGLFSRVSPSLVAIRQLGMPCGAASSLARQAGGLGTAQHAPRCACGAPWRVGYRRSQHTHTHASAQARPAHTSTHQDEHVALLNLHVVGRPSRRLGRRLLPIALPCRRHQAGAHAVVGGGAQRVGVQDGGLQGLEGSVQRRGHIVRPPAWPGCTGNRAVASCKQELQLCAPGVQNRQAREHDLCGPRHPPALQSCGPARPARTSAAARPASPACPPGGWPSPRRPPPAAAPARPRLLPRAAAPPSRARCACSGCGPGSDAWAGVGWDGIRVCVV